jgi:hypothetical protein
MRNVPDHFIDTVVKGVGHSADLHSSKNAP